VRLASFDGGKRIRCGRRIERFRDDWFGIHEFGLHGCRIQRFGIERIRIDQLRVK
jgi:hypothetical protein